MIQYIHIIGLGCQKLVGKDTVYEGLIEKFGHLNIFQRLSFGDIVKEDIDNLIIKPLKIDLTHIDKETIRPLWKAHGVFMREAVSEDYWVEKAFSKATDPNKIYVFTDVRFKNEHALLKKLGGTYVRIIRDSSPQDDHQSEQDMVDVDPDYIIYNNGLTKDEFKNVSSECISNILLSEHGIHLE